ncbi:MAG: GAF domain-containing protein, partial [Lachnospiraceae bacterium]|nr:GAF domain-containing protein [Lachnospiraceae bacterium]
MTERMSAKDYITLALQLEGLFEGEPDRIANLANASALLNETLEDINWAGFYFLKESTGNSAAESPTAELVLGPFQGRPACVRIAIGRGVCGTAVEKDEVQLVPDVHAFPGHIACDSASRSEIVIPLHADGKIVGVLDIDSPMMGRFTEEDRHRLLLCEEAIERILKISLFVIPTP